jgi:hypothetical protein
VPRTMKLLACLIALLCTGAAYAQTATPASTSSPVARVYVSRPTHLDAFDVSSAGKLTPVPGSPFSGISVYHLSVTKKFLFGASDDQKTIFTYSIASDGAVKQVASVDTTKYFPDGDNDCCFATQKLDKTGSTLYNNAADGSGDTVAETFKIESNGELQFIGNAVNNSFGDSDADPSGVSLLGNNQFAYQTGCDEDVPTEQVTTGYKRESSGLLQYLGQITLELPKAKSGDVYCPYALAPDSSDHLAMALLAWNLDQGEPDGPWVLASYTADSHGNLSTKSTMENMPPITDGTGNLTLSISPSGKLLAIASGGGFQVFHFNGADPIAKYTGLLHSSETFLQFGWDKDNHLYALSTTNLHVYSATPTSIKEELGSPYSIPEASSVIVWSLN